ncbi:MAG: universal stress protein, partial [Rhodothermaceae bacterium]|nr:universal stress protein [Rhodothermaceae bacterium]
MFAPTRILAPVDFSSSATAALHRALDLAERTGAALHVLHIVPGTEPITADEIEGMTEPDRAFFQRVWDRADGELTGYLRRERIVGTKLKRVLSYGHPSEVILDYVNAQGVDLVVMGTHGRRGLRHFLLGSVAEEVLRRAQVPVLVVPEHADGRVPIKRVLAPTDFSDAARHAVATALALAERYDAQLDLLHVLIPMHFLKALAGVQVPTDFFPELRARSEQQLATFAEGAPMPVGRHIEEGRA